MLSISNIYDLTMHSDTEKAVPSLPCFLPVICGVWRKQGLVQFNGIFQENLPDSSEKTAGRRIPGMPVQQADFPLK